MTERLLITGAASGLGLALAKQYVSRGARILATDRFDDCPESLRNLPGVIYRKLDVTSDVDWRTAHDWVTEEFGGLDLLFNNAGVAAGGPIETTEMDQWQWIVDINLLGVARGCRTFVPMFKAQGKGVIVNTASAAGLVHPPQMSEYSTVKAGVVAMSESLFHELKPYGIHIAVICPSFFRTNLTESIRSKDETARASAEKLITKAKRDADDIAAVVVKGVDKRKHIILTELDGRIAYSAKRFMRPIYDRVVGKAADKMMVKES